MLGTHTERSGTNAVALHCCKRIGSYLSHVPVVTFNHWSWGSFPPIPDSHPSSKSELPTFISIFYPIFFKLSSFYLCSKVWTETIVCYPRPYSDIRFQMLLLLLVRRAFLGVISSNIREQQPALDKNMEMSTHCSLGNSPTFPCSEQSRISFYDRGIQYYIPVCSLVS